MNEKKIGILVGMVITLEGWYMIWMLRTLMKNLNSQLDVNIEHLMRPIRTADLRMELPLSDRPTLFRDVTGYGRHNMFKHRYVFYGAQNTKPLLEVHRQDVIIRDAALFVVQCMTVAVIIAKLSLNYYPAFWRYSTGILRNGTAQVVFFFAFDDFLNRCIPVPLGILWSLSEPSIFPEVQTFMIRCGLNSLNTAFKVYIAIQVIDRMGIAAWSFSPLAIASIKLLLATPFVIAYRRWSRRPLLTESEKSRVVNGCNHAEYNYDKIRMNHSNKFPVINYFSSIFANLIYLSHEMVHRLKDNDGLEAMVVQELGKRSCWYWEAFYAASALKCIGVGCVLMLTYNSEFINDMCGFKNDVPHVIFSLYVAESYIVPRLLKIVNMVSNMIEHRFVYWCDKYACKRGYAKALINALWTVSATSCRYPIFEEGCHAEFMDGAPLVQDRVKEMEQYEVKK